MFGKKEEPKETWELYYITDNEDIWIASYTEEAYAIADYKKARKELSKKEKYIELEALEDEDKELRFFERKLLKGVKLTHTVW